jgi:two-component system LytT family response regulator
MENRAELLRALIVDDEPLARRNLLALLARDATIQVAGQCGSAEEALEAIPKIRPDLVFLDIQMPECDGFELLEKLGPDLPFSLVFVTAHQEFALRAFEVGALEYLLKPFDDRRFAQMLERVKTRSRITAAGEKFIVKNGNAIDVVELRDIDWFEACDYYSTMHAGGKTYMLRRSLSDLERQLASHSFCRIHRSAIVNLERVCAIESGNSGDYDVVLADGTRLPLSRRHRKALLERLSGNGESLPA